MRPPFCAPMHVITVVALASAAWASFIPSSGINARLRSSRVHADTARCSTYRIAAPMGAPQTPNAGALRAARCHRPATYRRLILSATTTPDYTVAAGRGRRHRCDRTPPAEVRRGRHWHRASSGASRVAPVALAGVRCQAEPTPLRGFRPDARLVATRHSLGRRPIPWTAPRGVVVRDVFDSPPIMLCVCFDHSSVKWRNHSSISTTTQLR